MSDVFTADGFQESLRGYEEFSQVWDWPIRKHFQLYSDAKGAQVTVDPDESGRLFCRWYTFVTSWPGFKRGGGVASAREASQLLTHHAGSLSSLRGITLPHMKEASARQCVGGVLAGLRTIKPNVDYPWMAVSKVLHFVNPSLMPKYDNAAIWNGVMFGERTSSAAFGKSSYLEFCRTNGYVPKEMGARFLTENYMQWAAGLMDTGNDTLMQTFQLWYAEQVAGLADPFGVLNDIVNYHAVAFEYGVLGAAYRAGYLRK